MIKLNSEKQFVYKITSFQRGLNNFLEPNKIDDTELSVARNVIFTDRGAPIVRGGTKVFGDSQSNKITLLANFVKPDNTTEIVIISNGIFKRYNTTTEVFDTVTGYTFSTTADCTSVNYKGKLYIANGVDPLTMYDGTALTRFTSLATPTGLTITRGSSLSAGSYEYSYKVTAVNNVGETQASTAVTITTNKRREEWNFDRNAPDLNSSVTLNWNAVTGATAYNIYGVIGTKETYLDTVNTNSYRDLGFKTPSLLFSAPIANTTEAPKGKYITIYNSSLIIAGDPSKPNRIYYSAGVDRPEDFSLGSGGGWMDVNDGADDGIITCLYVFNNHLIIFKNRSIWSFRFNQEFPVLSNINDNLGCVSFNAATEVNNDLFFVAEDINGIALFTLGYEPTFQSVLRTNKISVRVNNSVNNVLNSNFSKTSMVYLQGKLFISFTDGTAVNNNRILVYDRERAAFSIFTDLTASKLTVLIFNDEQGVYYIDDSDNTVTKYDSTYITDKNNKIEWEITTKYFDFNQPFYYKKLKWVNLKFFNTNKDIKLKINFDDTYYQNTYNVTSNILSTVLGVARLGIARLGKVDTTNLEYNTTLRIPVERLGVQSICKQVYVTIKGNSIGSKAALQNLEFIYKIKNESIKMYNEIEQI